MKKIFIILSFILFFVTAEACLNEYHITKTGNKSIDAFSMYDLYLQRNFDSTKIKDELEELKEDTSTDRDNILYNQNDIATHLIKLGRLGEAKTILEGLFKSYPDEYNVIINLGTLYELMGQGDKALAYIRRAMTINPDSHKGSEWFHIKVLEYKLRKRNTNQISKDNILDIRNSTLETSDLAYGIAYQLQERVPFTPVPDLIMAKILLEYGDFLADSVSIKAAYVVYAVAEAYDSEKILSLATKKNDLLLLFKKYKIEIPDYKDYFFESKNVVEEKSDLLKAGVKKENPRSSTWIYILGGLLFIFLLVLLKRLKK